MGEVARTPAVDLIEQVVNTLDVEGGDDAWATPEALEAWLAERRLLEPGTAPSRPDLERTRAVREAVRALLLANNEGATPDPAAPRVLNDAAARARLTMRFAEDGGVAWEPLSRGVDAAGGRILAAGHRSMAEGTWSRLKACRRHSCLWVFFDASRNRSRSWCSMRVCGNRTKAEQYRRRHSGSTRA